MSYFWTLRFQRVDAVSMIQLTATAPLFEETSGFDNVNKVMNHLKSCCGSSTWSLECALPRDAAKCKFHSDFVVKCWLVVRMYYWMDGETVCGVNDTSEFTFYMWRSGIFTPRWWKTCIVFAAALRRGQWKGKRKCVLRRSDRLIHGVNRY